MTSVAFDIDGTLIRKDEHGEDVPCYAVIQFVISFLDQHIDVYFWSGGGIDYAKRWSERLGFAKDIRIAEKGSFFPDICFDDQVVSLGRVNIQVK